MIDIISIPGGTKILKVDNVKIEISEEQYKSLCVNILSSFDVLEDLPEDTLDYLNSEYNK